MKKIGELSTVAAEEYREQIADCVRRARLRKGNRNPNLEQTMRRTATARADTTARIKTLPERAASFEVSERS